MVSAWGKNNRREIRHTLGRWLAILGIVALGIGFFAGLKAAKPAMLQTGSEYLERTNLFDARLISPLGMTQADADYFSALSYVKSAECSSSSDILAVLRETEHALKVISLPQEINQVELTAGRMPEAANECLADDLRFTSADIGETLTVTSEYNPLSTEEVTIVGLCQSPLYLNIVRGTTSLGSGSIYAFLYLPREAFVSPIDTELYVRFADMDTTLYSDAYETRYAELEKLLTEEMEQQKPGYLLSRETNTGYIAFRNDSSIVEGVAKVFPLFFFCVAAFVCITTMTRMLDEHRTQIGTLKALGYSDGRIAWKYISYSGSAALIGCIAGFFLGTWLFPLVIWEAYTMLYHFAPLEYIFDPRMAVLSLAASTLCSVGATWLTCRSELRQMPAKLMRPRAPKAGKRIILEHIPLLWNRFSFLYKVCVRNIMRYKKRLLMMLIGIGGCTALIATGFGVRDSIAHVADNQFDDILCYDIEVSFNAPMDAAQQEEFRASYENELSHCAFLYSAAHEAKTELAACTLYVIATDDPAITDMVHLQHDDQTVAYPAQGVVIDERMAETLGLEVGDLLPIFVDDTTTVEAEIVGLCENHVYHYAYMSAATYAALFRQPYAPATAFVTTEQDPYAVGAALSNDPSVAMTNILAAMRKQVDDMMVSLDYIVIVVIFSACSLAFIVIYNLSNISITERAREIATIKVLGFYPRETQSYVFREILLLTVSGAVVGLPSGKLLHAFVMAQIRIEMVAFDVRIAPLSYLCAFAITVVLALLVDLLLMHKIDRIDMAQSLKSVE